MTPAETVEAAFVIFARTGGCLLAAPGFSSLRVPVTVRLMLALSASLVLLPLHGAAAQNAAGDGALALTRALLHESLIGIAIGLTGRVFFWALETLASAAALTMGLSNPFAPVDGDAGLPVPAAFIGMMALALFFAADAHHEVLRGLGDSYQVMPPGTLFDGRGGLGHLAAVMGEAFVLALRATAPLIVFPLVLNVILGLVSRMSPAMQAYFLLMPFAIATGLAMMALAIPGLAGVFVQGLAMRLRLG